MKYIVRWTPTPQLVPMRPSEKFPEDQMYTFEEAKDIVTKWHADQIEQWVRQTEERYLAWITQ